MDIIKVIKKMFKSKIENIKNEDNLKSYKALINDFNEKVDNIKKCGGKASIQRQHNKGRLTARERINYCI